MPTRSPDPGPPGAGLAAELAGLDHVLPGSLLHRWMRCGKTNCRCKADPPTLHGPYFQWTRTVDGACRKCPEVLIETAQLGPG